MVSEFRPESLSHIALNLQSRSWDFAELLLLQGTWWGRVRGKPSSRPSDPTQITRNDVISGPKEGIPQPPG